MYADADRSGRDPRRGLSEGDLREASRLAAPEVARPQGASDTLGLAVGVVAALGLGAITLVTLSNNRTKPNAPPSPVETVQPLTPMAPPPAVLAAAAPLPAVATVAAASQPQPANVVDPNQSRAGPMVVDNTGIEAATGPARSGPAAAPKPEAAGLSQDEQFALRAGGDAPPVARAQGLSDVRSLVVQGTIIPAVLETALNSDLPGYARAIVSRDVRGFDGAQVVIPRGSRLIGQYKSGLATGQSRAFIVWNRLIRPDGVSVQLASPVADSSGESGLSGKVDRHFVQRFGSAVMLSVVSGLAGSLGGGSSTVVIGADAQSAASAALASDSKISPTVRVPQGTPIQVFTARDLDFSGF